jgi:hypothetical protein
MPGQLAVYRIVLRRSVEERLLQLADRYAHMHAAVQQFVAACRNNAVSAPAASSMCHANKYAALCENVSL